MYYRNSEGFSDPMAGEAIGHVMKERQNQKRETWRKETKIKERRKVYIASKYAGDVKKNTENTIRYCQGAVKVGCIPVAAHLLYPQILDDRDLEERKLGLLFGQALLAVCDEAWFIGKKMEDGQIELSEGMKAEYREARRLKMKIRMIPEEVFDAG